jgi:two-component system response regulator FixJ
MTTPSTVLMLESDLAVREAVTFALGLEGYCVQPLPGPEAIDYSPLARCLVVSHDGVAAVEQARARGWIGPAIILATHPSRRLRERIRTAGARLIEKPLMDGALSDAVRASLAADFSFKRG